MNFKLWCCTNKAIPLVFDNSLSYYECLSKLVSYVNSLTTDIKTIGEAQQKLQEYVDNYFTNLDVQQEINNKLDEMAESGELENLINNFLMINPFLTFDTISDMKNSDNITTSCKVKTFGFYTLNDGGGALYTVKEKEDEIVDDVTIISLKNNLIAKISCDEINIKQFGCKGDGQTDDSANLKIALNYANENNINSIFVPNGTYILNTQGSDQEIINLKSNQKLYGENNSILKLSPNNTSGTNAIISTSQSILNKNIEISNLIIDGNSGQISGSRNFSNICLWNVSNSKIENVTSLNSLYCGIMVRALETFKENCSNVIINNCIVENSKYIGIQSSFINNLIVSNNIVNNSGDNAIDIYGNFENDTANTSYNAIVSNNNIFDSLKCGIFIESIPYCNVYGNNMKKVRNGIQINRINSGANNLSITDNILKGDYSLDQQNYGKNGIVIANNCYFINLQNNFIEDFFTAINCDNVSNINISNNNFKNIADIYLIYLSKKNNALIRSKITNNSYFNNDGTAPKKYMTQSYGSASPYPSRFLGIMEFNYNLRDFSTIDSNLYYKVIPLLNNSSWGGGARYALGNTDLWTNRSATAGDYLFNERTSTFYKVLKYSGGVITIQNEEGVSGDYTSQFQVDDMLDIYSEENYNALKND